MPTLFHRTRATSMPGVDVVEVLHGTSSAVHPRSSSWTPPDVVWPRRFPRRSPPGLLTPAARGGLGPEPAPRSRGALPHLPCSMACSSRLSAVERAFVAHRDPRTCVVRPVDRTGRASMRLSGRRRARASRRPAGRARDRTWANSRRGTSSCTSDGLSNASTDHAARALTRPAD